VAVRRALRRSLDFARDDNGAVRRSTMARCGARQWRGAALDNGAVRRSMFSRR
jgi:hypothetical protein